MGEVGGSHVDWFLIATATPNSPSALMQLLTTLTQFASVGLGLGFVIFVHELGHFLVAKACGVKCEKFYVGFDFFELNLGPIKIPSAIWKKQIGETEYGIGILPLGGYVKMLGQDDDPRNAEAEAERCRIEGTEPSAPVALDPRSYPAKSVPQRMAIISAGVIMNLITGVMIAAVAYTLGVSEIPAVIGNVIPGDPAWKAGLAPGDKIIKIGSAGKASEDLRFRKDLTMQIIFNGPDRPLELTVRHADNKEEVLTVTPTNRLKPATGMPASLGVIGPSSLDLAIVSDEMEAHFRPKSDHALYTGDRVTEINGTKVTSAHEVNAWLAANPSTPLTLTITRLVDTKENRALPADKQARDEMKIVVEPQLRRGAGLTMQAGPIAAIRPGSPAEKAGLKEGDKLVTIQGEKPGDILSLGQRLLPQVGKPIELVVERAKSDASKSKSDASDATETVTISITPEAPRASFEHGSTLGCLIGVEPLGIAMNITSTVAEVSDDSPLKGTVQVGDIVSAAKTVPDNADAGKVMEKSLPKEWLNGFKLDDNAHNWTAVNYLQNVLPSEFSVELTVLHDGVPKSVKFKPIELANIYEEDRHLIFREQQAVIKADSLGTALSLGAREIKERITEVFTVISRLITGRLAATNLSGPLGILSAAGASASRGTATLLMFFTLLSANLAVLNILPIPALDGGHLVFLAAEWLRGKPVDERLQIRLTVGGVLCLLSLMVFATFNDITMFFFRMR